jgi:hypothetical protein
MYEDSTWRSRAECRGDNAVYFFAPSHFERKRLLRRRRAESA